MTLPIEPLQLLYEDTEPRSLDLPDLLEAHYGGGIGFERPTVVANVVSSLDGVVALPAITQSSAIINDGNDADRFVMGLLRACADAVLIGSGTMQASPTSIWTAERVYPPAADAYAELRQRLGLTERPTLAILTASGSIDVDHPALAAGAVVLTTQDGAARLDDGMPEASSLVVLPGTDAVDVRAAVEHLREGGARTILSEAGPAVIGSLLAAGALDELFLTVSPILAGRDSTRRLGLVEGRELLPDEHVAGRLMSARRQREHLFLRYRIT